MNKPKSIIMPIIALAISMASADISRNCTEEIINISRGNGFDVQKFISDLPPAVVKAKLQAKAPFGKPKDGDKTDIGMTFGCLKSFPESPTEIQSLLKNIGLETAKGIVANKLGTPANKENNVGTANNASNSPALKECDAVFNPNKKFCYDGEVYNLCDGMSYNPTTHICSGDIANRALCKGVQYNPLDQKCENNTIIAECGETTYNPATYGCKDNIVFPRCGASLYNPATQGCKGNVLFPICGENFYDPKTFGCKDNVVFALPKCGDISYNPATQGCKGNVLFTRCGENFYDPKTFGCKDNVVFVLPKCGDIPYNPAMQTCKDNVVLSRCGAYGFYNPKTQKCRYGSVFAK